MFGLLNSPHPHLQTIIPQLHRWENGEFSKTHKKIRQNVEGQFTQTASVLSKIPVLWRQKEVSFTLLLLSSDPSAILPHTSVCVACC